MRLTILFIILMGFAWPAAAAEDKGGGMRHRTIRQSEKTLTRERAFEEQEDEKFLKIHKSFENENFEEGDVTSSRDAAAKIAPYQFGRRKNDDTAPENKMDEAVWNKYRALAAGKAGEDAPASEDKSKDAPADAEPDPQAAAPAAQPTGLAAILDDYRKTKSKRSQMRTISIKQPELPKAPEKPEPPVKE